MRRRQRSQDTGRNLSGGTVAIAKAGECFQYAKLFTKDGKGTVMQAISRDKLEGLKKE